MNNRFGPWQQETFNGWTNKHHQPQQPQPNQQQKQNKDEKKS